MSKIKKIGLAPMAGYTDSNFRTLCRKYGADVVFSEMISARGVIEDYKQNGAGKSLELAHFSQVERPIVLQIFGKEPSAMADAARILVDTVNPDGIDINMGCPAPKIVKNFN